MHILTRISSSINYGYLKPCLASRGRKLSSVIIRCMSTRTENIPENKKPLPERFFITTPIYYVNAVPHIGHLYSNVLADAISRWYTLRGVPVTFSTGTDEHGLKIQQAASSQGIPTEKFCDTMSSHFKTLFDKAEIGYTDYIRTTEKRHKDTVCEMWNTLYGSGYIYKGVYEGWYSVSDEAFLTDTEVMETVDKNGNKIMVSKESGRSVEWMKEENYKFRLSDMSDSLTRWLDKGKVIYPETFEPMVRHWIKEGLPDLSVSRSRTRIPWGIPVPNDDQQTIYVWLDALVNYLTIGGYSSTNQNASLWPVDCHIVGKDILRFHAVYWPAFLMAAGLEPPKQILCHSHWLYDKEKMSKSRGNVVDPFDRLSRYSPDGLRYYLLKDGVPHHDGHFTDERAVECINSDLVNTFGNLLSRSTSPTLNPSQTFPPPYPSSVSQGERELLHQLHQLPGLLTLCCRLGRKRPNTFHEFVDRVDSFYRSYDTHRALDAIMTQLYHINAFVQERKPWELAKQQRAVAMGGASYQSDVTSEVLLSNVLHVAMETLRVTSVLLQPVIPTLANRVLDRLNVPTNQRTFKHVIDSETDYSGRSLGPDTGPLIPRIKIDKL